MQVAEPTSLTNLLYNAKIGVVDTWQKGHFSVSSMMQHMNYVVRHQDNNYSRTKLFWLFWMILFWIFVRISFMDLMIKFLKKRYQIKFELSKKITENVTKTLFMGLVYPFVVYFLFQPENSIFLYDPLTALGDYPFKENLVPFSISLLYMFRLSYCLSSVWMSFSVETLRSDYPILVLHHFCTILLIYTSDLIKIHSSGLVVLFIHDSTDLLLGITKTFSYVAKIDTAWKGVFIFMQNTFYVLFMIVWILFRNLLYPRMILNYYNLPVIFDWPVEYNTCQQFFCIFSTILASLHVYWLILIIKNLFKILKQDYNDVREYNLNFYE